MNSKYTGFFAGHLKVERVVPELDFFMEWNNRLWGVSNKDNTIYASKLGDPMSWDYYQNTSMDSYYAQQGTNTTAQTQKILDALSQNKIESLQAQVTQLQMQNAMCGVVRYPNATTYCSGSNPFGNCGCGVAI